MSEPVKTVSEGGAAQQVNVERLLEPVRLGPYDLPSRLVVARLTRSRALRPGNVPFSLNACYYEQRASAALIISEATQVSRSSIPPRKQSPWRFRPSMGHDTVSRQELENGLAQPGIKLNSRTDDEHFQSG
jgi:NADH:flavin oxidoreductase / NADH oxidase family